MCTPLAQDEDGPAAKAVDEDDEDAKPAKAGGSKRKASAAADGDKPAAKKAKPAKACPAQLLIRPGLGSRPELSRQHT
jgi:hypothetical protein